MRTEKKPLLILTGPTAVGKTGLSLGLAKALGGEIISADSMQIYKKMNIGTAKIMPGQMQGVPHHLIDVLDPAQAFNVVMFQKLAAEAADQIYQNGHLPILVGGTGFYIQALLYDIDFSRHQDTETYRKELLALFEERGGDCLYEMLKEADPEYARIVHPHNTKKVIRGLEFYKETGQRLSEHNRQQRQKESPYRYLYLVLTDDREKLYRRIDQRVDEMMQAGLMQEVRSLIRQGYTKNLVSMQGLGYKEFFDYFDHKITLEAAVDQIKRDTRHFAKRQLTWFRREKDVCWIHKENYPSEEALLRELVFLARQRLALSAS